MMNKTDIEYLTHTWNPIAMRCTKVSRGCANCWHLRECKRMAANPKFPPKIRAAYAGEGPPILLPGRLEAVMKRKKPAVVGTQFMGDLFHEKISETAIYRVWSAMLLAPQHIFVILTKRPERMEDWSNWLFRGGDIPPSPNIWPGVSIEDQETADERIPFLLRTSAAKRIVSVEPALTPVDLSEWLWCYDAIYPPGGGYPEQRLVPSNDLDGIIAGGESGSGARPTHVDAFRGLRDQCAEHGIPFFFKQWGEWLHESQVEPVAMQLGDKYPLHRFEDGSLAWRVGKKNAGRLLDGREWNQLPGR